MAIIRKEELKDRLVILQQFNYGRYVVTMYCEQGTLSSRVYKSRYNAILSFITFRDYPISIIKERYAY